MVWASSSCILSPERRCTRDFIDTCSFCPASAEAGLMVVLASVDF